MITLQGNKTGSINNRFRRITFPKDKALLLCLFTFFYVYFIGFFTFNFGIPETAYYVTDVLLILCLLLSIKRTTRAFHYKRLMFFSTILILLVLFGFTSAFINGFKPVLWIWSLRNWGRFFLFFYLCVALLDKKWIDKMLSMTVNVFLVNVVVIAFQFFVIKGMPQDSLNGLVGRNTSGANTVLTMAAAIIVSAEYVSKKCKLKKLLTVFSGVFIVSILAELKALILFAILIFGIILLVNSKLTGKDILRFIGLAVLAIIAVIIGLRALAKVYPEFAKIMSIQGFIGAVTSEGGYGNSGYIDRLTAVNVIQQYLFGAGNTVKNFIGIGMGNAEYSTIAGLTSDFFLVYGNTFRYLGFAISMLYVESGYIGLGLYIALFMLLIISTGRTINAEKVIPQLRRSCYYESIGFGMAFLGLIYIWYNNLLRTDMAVLMSFYMAIPFALTRKGANTINGI